MQALELIWTTLDSPLGSIRLISHGDALISLSWYRIDEDFQPTHVKRPFVLKQNDQSHAKVKDQLHRYFDGSLRDFDLKLSLDGVSPFSTSVLTHMQAIPYGKCSTYVDLASKAGSPRAARAAGNACANNPIPIIIPCHRVLAQGGKLGGYNGGLDKKRFLLDLER